MSGKSEAGKCTLVVVQILLIGTDTGHATPVAHPFQDRIK